MEQVLKAVLAANEADAGASGSLDPQARLSLFHTSVTTPVALNLGLG